MDGRGHKYIYLNLIYVTHITPLEAVLVFKMLLLCSSDFQFADYISNLND